MALGLEGIKVVEMATMVATPMAGRLLGDWGADVIHVERLGTGDPWRGWISGEGTTGLPPEFHYHFWENYNRNKRSVAIDISQEGGRKIVYKLVKEADVFLTNMRPYELEKFKLVYDTLSQLNPGLIYGSLTGYGKKGPERDAPGQDTVAFWARSGFLYMLQQGGMPPASPGFRTLAAGDKLNAIALACGIILALLVRERTGLGQEVDISLFQTAVFALLPVALSLSTEEVPGIGKGEKWILREREEVSPLHISHQTKDGRWLQLSLAPPDLYWSRFCQAIEREELEHDPRFETTEARKENQADLFHILEDVFSSKTLDEWKTPLTEARLLWGPIQSPQEVVNDPQARANDFFVPYDHPTFGQIEVVANPIKLSKTPATVRTPAPELGQHTEEILLELGYNWDDISQLKEQRVIL